MSSVVKSTKSKVTVVLMAILMVLGLMALATPKASAVTPPSGMKFFYEDSDLTQPFEHGNECVTDYTVNEDGTVTLTFGPADILGFTGYISSFKVNGVEKFVSTGSQTGTATYTAASGQAVPIEIGITIVIGPINFTHPPVTGYAVVPGIV